MMYCFTMARHIKLKNKEKKEMQQKMEEHETHVKETSFA